MNISNSGSQASLVFLPQKVHQRLQQPVISVLVGFGVIENIDIVVIQTVLGVSKVGRFVQLFQGFIEIFVRDVGLCTWSLLWWLLQWWVFAESALQESQHGLRGVSLHLLLLSVSHAATAAAAAEALCSQGLLIPVLFCGLLLKHRNPPTKGRRLVI